jgi:hypothetical protein
VPCRCRALFLHVITYNTQAMSLYTMQGFACVARLSRFYYISTGRQPDPNTQVGLGTATWSWALQLVNLLPAGARAVRHTGNCLLGTATWSWALQLVNLLPAGARAARHTGNCLLGTATWSWALQLVNLLPAGARAVRHTGNCLTPLLKCARGKDQRGSRLRRQYLSCCGVCSASGRVSLHSRCHLAGSATFDSPADPMYAQEMPW